MKTIKADFENFKKEFLKWVDLFGLKDWETYFCCVPLGESYAEISADAPNCVTTLFFNSDLPDGLAGKNPKLCGKHEAIHLLLARLQSAPSKTQRAIESERIVRILEKLL